MPTGPFWLTLRQIVLRSGPPGGRLLTVPEAGDPPVPVPRAWIESDAECKLSLLGGAVVALQKDSFAPSADKHQASMGAHARAARTSVLDDVLAPE